MPEIPSSERGPDGVVHDAPIDVAEEVEPRGPQVSARFGDLITGLLFVALGAFTLLAGRDLAFRAEFGAGPGFLPRILAILLIGTGGALAAKQFVKPTQGVMALPSGRGAVKVVATIAMMVVAVVVIEDLGFILTAVLLLAVALFGVERKVTVTSGLIAVLLPLAFWTLFAVLLGVRLPAGLVSF